MTDRTKYAICCTQRSGSTYLCSLLRNAGLGNPAEYFHPESLAERIANWPLADSFRPSPGASGPQFLESVMAAQGEVAGIKINWQSLLVFRRDMGARPEELGFRLIYLSRRDKLRQAISWYRAVATRQWASLGEKSAQPPDFDWAKINYWLQAVGLDEVRWEHYLRNLGRSVLRITYEDIDDETVAQIGSFLGMQVPPRKRESELRVQRDELTDQWMERFLRDAGSDIIFGSQEMEQRLAET